MPIFSNENSGRPAHERFAFHGSASGHRRMRMKLPAHYAAARTALAKCRSIEEVKQKHNEALGLEVYAFKAKDKQLIENATVVKALAEAELDVRVEEERKAGNLSSGTRGQLRGVKPGKRGRRGSIAGGAIKTPPAKTKTLESFGIDKALAKRMRKAGKLSPEELEAHVAKAARLAVASVEDRSAVIAEARAARHQEKRQVREKREQVLANRIIALPKKRYGVILADPEWKFKFWSEKGKTNSSADNHYETSPLEVIKARDVPSIAADDCVLFLWATAPMKPQALEVMAAWGFRYVSQAVWVKDKPGTGYWFRNQHEVLLVGTRGKVPAPAEGDQISSVISAPAGKHSEKPDAVYEMIERYFPNLPKMELNARKARPGWECWGFDAPQNVEAAA
jgi:N6-adenosine-specific RNA methylase IME4